MSMITDLLMVVDAFRSARQVSDARVSTLVFNDGGKIRQLREGRDIGVLTAMRAFRWFSDNWPDGADWPKSVTRPHLQASASPATPDADLPAVASGQSLVG